MSKYLVIFGIMLLVLSGCGKRGIGFRSDLVVDPFDFQYLTAKAKIRFDDGTKELGGTANLRVQKDSVIWMSISPGLGVEVGRLLISTDSIFFIDRLNRNYLSLGYEQLSSEYNFDINYKLIEAIVIGNLIFPYKRESLKKEPEGLSYTQDFDNYVFTNYIGNVSHKLERLNVKDLDTETSISVNYGEFKEVGEEIFPFMIEATLNFASDAKHSTNISIGFNRAQIENGPLKFPFDVPDKYTVL